MGHGGFGKHHAADGERVVARDGLGASVYEERCELARYPRRSWREVIEEFREEGFELIAILRSFEIGKGDRDFHVHAA